jgi:Ca-activated chloride channel family protein
MTGIWKPSIRITEKDSYKTFETRVSKVRAGQDTRVRLVYLQPAAVDTGIGRYVYPLEEGGVDEAKLAFWTANEQVTGQFSFDLRLKSAYPVAAVRLPHQPQAIIQSQADGEWQVHLGNRAVATDGAASSVVHEESPTGTRTRLGG